MKNAQILARQLRRSLTPAERRLWYSLRDRRFARYKFRRQHPVGPYILDFACCSVRLAIELDGGQHDERSVYDARRTRWLQGQGWQVLRFWNNEFEHHEEAVMERILEALESPIPSPRPLCLDLLRSGGEDPRLIIGRLPVSITQPWSP